MKKYIHVICKDKGHCINKEIDIIHRIIIKRRKSKYTLTIKRVKEEHENMSCWILTI
jgi:hypothetical protein